MPFRPLPIPHAKWRLSGKGLVWQSLVMFLSTIVHTSQAWCLARLFPLILLKGSVVIPEDDKHWMNFMLLLKITDYLLSPTQSKDGAAYLKVLISDHHSQFVNLYPTCHIIPKMHYLIHYPDWIVRYSAGFFFYPYMIVIMYLFLQMWTTNYILVYAI